GWVKHFRYSAARSVLFSVKALSACAASKSMRMRNVFCATGLLIGIAGASAAQVSLNRTPSRAIGHPRLLTNTIGVDTGNPNLVEGREFYLPQVVALDSSLTPPVLYVSDTLNNRVL